LKSKKSSGQSHTSGTFGTREFIIEPLEKTEGCKKTGDEVTEELE
jgi:hypothetical protein